MLPSPSTAPSLRLGEWLFALGLGLALCAAYHNTWHSPFVFDDVTAIPDNASLRSWASALHPPVDTTAGGRPVLNLSFALNHRLSPNDGVRGYHLVNLSILWAGALLLFGTARRVALRIRGLAADSAAWLAGSAALLWALHPLQTESVTYLVQRAESLMGLFYLAALYGVVRCAEAVSRRAAILWGVVATVCCWLGVGTKEVAVSIPVMAFALDRTAYAGSWSEAWRRRRWLYVGMASSWILLTMLVWSTHGRNGTSGFGVSFGWLQFLRTQAFAVIHYLRLSVWPRGLTIDYGTYWIDRASWWMPCTLLTGALLAASVQAFFQGRLSGWLGLWFFAVLAPTLLVPGSRQTLAEHRMYLALAPVLLLLVGALWQRAGKWTLFAVAGLAVALGVATERRNRVYESEVALWEDAVAKVPGNAYAWNNLGFAQFRRGQLTEAEAAYRTALRLMPVYADAWNNLGAAEQQEDRLVESRAAFEQALRIDPANAATRRNYANLLVKLGDSQAAYAEAEASLRLQPDSPDAYNTMGEALAGLQRLPEAEAAFRHALALAPRHALALNGLGITLLQEGRPAEALAQLNASLVIDPHSGMARANQAAALAALGRPEEADRAYRAAEGLSPALAGIRFNHARVLFQLGNYAAASAAYAEAARLDPQQGLAYYNWAISLYREGKIEALIPVLKRATELLPAAAEVHNMYGAVLLMLSRPREALAEFERVQQLAPQTPGLAENLAAARRALRG